MRATEFTNRQQPILEGKHQVQLGDLVLHVYEDGQDVDVRVMDGDRQVGYVIFLRDGKLLIPDDLFIDQEYRGRGVAKKIYDYVKSLGFKIIRSGIQTNMGKRFWDKNRGEHVDVWEEGVAEGSLNEFAPDGFNSGGDNSNDLQLYLDVAKKLNMKKYKPSTAHALIAKKMAELVDVVDDDKVDYARHMARKAQGLPNMLEQGVAEGKELDQKQVRETLNAWMNKDQQYKDPTSRVKFQTQIWPYIQKNIEIILNDKGDKGNGDYPSAPYAAWLLVQHMDAFPQNQIYFYKRLKRAIPNHPKIQFLRDRAAVNQWIIKHTDDPKYYYKNKPLPNPTVNVRNPKIFKDAGIIATSREEALQNAKEAGNKLLVAAVQATNALTQPSFQQGVAEGHLKEDVGGNYLYYSVESSENAKLILSSGYIEASGGAQTATQQQTKLPVVSVSRSIYYAVSGANVERDYKVVFVLDRNAIESRYKTFGTSQHEPTKSDNIFYNDTSQNYKLFQKYSKIDTNRDGKMSDQELDAYYAIPGNTTSIDKRPSAVMAQLLNKKYATLLTKYNRSKSGKEFEEVIPVKSGQLPLKGILVGFYLVPNKAAAKDQELLNHPMRLTMPRPNTFVKVTQQGVAEAISWSSLDEGLSLEDKMAIFEEYAIRGNLTESIDQELGVTEAWSEKYKRSINCKNPKGFSQRAHCQGRKKNNEQVELDERKRKRKKKTARYYYGPAYYFGATDTGAEGGDGGGLEEDWKKSLANVGLAGAIGLGAVGGLELKDKIKSAFTKPTAQTTQPVQAKSQQVQVSPITNNPLETYLMNVAKKSGLTGIELAQFLGQCAHETMDYKRMIERGAKKYFNKYEPKFAPGKAKLLGNVKPGDGERYKGRGYIQLTGRYNYKTAGKALNLPLEQNPELAAQPEIAAQIALWYWGQRVKPEVQNFADTTSVTRKINPGLSGLEDRHENFLSYIAQRDD